jgi:hypothetical protein
MVGAGSGDFLDGALVGLGHSLKPNNLSKSKFPVETATKSQQQVVSF